MPKSCKQYLYLIIVDFDETLAKTFSPSPNGITVQSAYSKAVKSIFGTSGLIIFEQQGGLNNRAPLEVVYDILRDGNKSELTAYAQNFLVKEGEYLDQLIPREKAIPLVWQSWNPHNTITEMLVRCKLSHLMKEIGTELKNGEKWPVPCNGVLEFFKTLDILGQNEKAGINVAILSSGHDEFIQKTFELWDLKCPSILITDDDMRKLMYPIDPMEIVKPSVKLFNLTNLLWFTHIVGPIYNELDLIGFVTENRKRMVYCGDDLVKDGQLSEAAEVPFGWFSSETKNYTLNCPTFTFSDWGNVAKTLLEEKSIEMFEKGRPFSEIIAPLL